MLFSSYLVQNQAACFYVIYFVVLFLLYTVIENLNCICINTTINLHPVFKALFDNAQKAEMELAMVRTQNNGSTIGQNNDLWVVCPVLRRR